MHRRGRWVVCPFLLLFFVNVVVAQASIPRKLDGFWYGSSRIDSQVFIEAFFDPVCPDTRDAWPPLKQILKHYDASVSLLVHTFPLPYHDNAFVCSRALHIVDKLNPSATYNLLEAFFEHQDEFYGKATFNMSRASAIDKIVKFTAKAIGNSYYAAIESGFNDSKTDQATRISFKYGCLRGVYGTPFFFVNGFPLPDAGSAVDYNGWRAIIDPLVHTEKPMKQESHHFFL